MSIGSDDPLRWFLGSLLDGGGRAPGNPRRTGLRIKIGAIHTYLELFGRYFIDLTPKVALIAAQHGFRCQGS